jgi:hypothetical protein
VAVCWTSAGAWKATRRLASAIAVCALACSTGAGQTETDRSRLQDAPYRASEAIRGIAFQLSTRRTEAPGSDIWPITWADDGHQYTAFGDGAGFGASAQESARGPLRVSMGVARIEGDWHDYRGVNLWGGKDAQNPATFEGKGTGILCVDGVLYMWVAGPGSTTVPETQLAVSSDHSRTWRLADWKWTMHDGVFAGTFLNFGRDYAGARDDFTYSYFTRLDTVPDKPRNWMHEVPGRIDLARVPKDRMLEKAGYEWFAGLNERGEASWTREMASRSAAFEDPAGIKVVSVCYQPQLRRYLLVYNPRDNRGNFGLFEASEPWGPWQAVSYLRGYEPFMPPEPNQRVSIFHFAPAWWSEDGREFTLVFNTGDDAWSTMRGRLLLSGD